MIKRIVLTLSTIALFLAPVAPVSADCFSFNGYQYRAVITIDSDLVDSDLEHFPFLITGAHLPDEFWIAGREDGLDTVITDISGNILPRELVTIDKGAKSLELYVATDIDDDVDPQLVIWWGSDEIVPNSTDVWDSSFVFVSHMNDQEGGTKIYDSTSNANHGTKGGNPTEVDGLVGKAQSFDGGDDLINFSDISISTSDLTLEAFNKAVSGVHITHKGIYRLTDSSTTTLDFYYSGSTWGNKLTLNINSSTAYYGNTADLIDDNYHHVVAVRDNNNAHLYLDGSIDGTHNDIFAGLDLGNVIRFGLRDADRYFPGLCSETRISKTARDGGWIGYTSTNMQSNSTTYTCSLADSVWVKNLTGSVDGNNIVLSWDYDGLNDVVIIRGHNNYPADINDGVEIYRGEGIEAVDYGVADWFREVYYKAYIVGDYGNINIGTKIRVGENVMIFLVLGLVGILAFLSIFRGGLIVKLALGLSLLSIIWVYPELHILGVSAVVVFAMWAFISGAFDMMGEKV